MFTARYELSIYIFYIIKDNLYSPRVVSLQPNSYYENLFLQWTANSFLLLYTLVSLNIRGLDISTYYESCSLSFVIEVSSSLTSHQANLLMFPDYETFTSVAVINFRSCVLSVDVSSLPELYLGCDVLGFFEISQILGEGVVNLWISCCH